MKQKDIAALILIVAITMISTWIIFDSFINTEQSRSKEVKKIEPIEVTFPDPQEDEVYTTQIFVDDFINPTELIKIGESNTEVPFEED